MCYRTSALLKTKRMPQYWKTKIKTTDGPQKTNKQTNLYTRQKTYTADARAERNLEYTNNTLI